MRIIVERENQGVYRATLVPPKNVPVAPVQLEALTLEALMVSVAVELDEYNRVKALPFPG